LCVFVHLFLKVQYLAASNLIFWLQFCGINAVLYFTPQILMQSGAGDLLANIGIDGESASIMASGVTCFLMLPCIMMAMWLMDRSGRRYISCSSLPFLTDTFE
jgi:hypothetical protein